MGHYPHVTAILRIMKDEYEDAPEDALRHAQERGSALHGLCCQHLASMMELCPKPSEIEAEYCAGYLGFLEWVEANDVTPFLVEQYSVNEKDGYCGNPDALVQYGDGTLHLVDLKFTAVILRTNKVQIQMYHKLAGYTRATHLDLIHIKPDTGKWEPIPVPPNPRDYIAFKSAINLFHWRAA